MKKIKLIIIEKLLSIYALLTGKKIASSVSQDHIFTKIIVYSTTALGDFMFNTPAIRALRQRYPEAQIALVIDPKNKEFIKGYKQVDQIFFWDGKLQGILRFIKQLRNFQPQIAVILHAHQPYDIISAVAAGCEYIVHRNLGNEFAHFRKWVTINKDHSYHAHLIQKRLDILALLGCRTDDVEMEIPCFYNHLSKDAHKIIIGFQMGTSNSDLKRRWPVSHFAQLAQQLLQASKQIEIHLIGTKLEEVLGQEFQALLTEEDSVRVVNHMGTTTLPQLLSLIEQMDTLVTGDTGPLHLAIALKTPVVALFTATNTVAGPYQDSHLHETIYTPEKSISLGISSITPQQVFLVLQNKLLNKKAAE